MTDDITLEADIKNVFDAIKADTETNNVQLTDNNSTRIKQLSAEHIQFIKSDARYNSTRDDIFELFTKVYLDILTIKPRLVNTLFHELLVEMKSQADDKKEHLSLAISLVEFNEIDFPSLSTTAITPTGPFWSNCIQTIKAGNFNKITFEYIDLLRDMGCTEDNLKFYNETYVMGETNPNRILIWKMTAISYMIFLCSYGKLNWSPDEMCAFWAPGLTTILNIADDAAFIALIKGDKFIDPNKVFGNIKDDTGGRLITADLQSKFAEQEVQLHLWANFKNIAERSYEYIITPGIPLTIKLGGFKELYKLHPELLFDTIITVLDQNTFAATPTYSTFCTAVKNINVTDPIFTTNLKIILSALGQDTNVDKIDPRDCFFHLLEHFVISEITPDTTIKILGVGADIFGIPQSELVKRIASREAQFPWVSDILSNLSDQQKKDLGFAPPIITYDIANFVAAIKTLPPAEIMTALTDGKCQIAGLEASKFREKFQKISESELEELDENKLKYVCTVDPDQITEIVEIIKLINPDVTELNPVVVDTIITVSLNGTFLDGHENPSMVLTLIIRKLLEEYGGFNTDAVMTILKDGKITNRLNITPATPEEEEKFNELCQLIIGLFIEISLEEDVEPVPEQAPGEEEEEAESKLDEFLKELGITNEKTLEKLQALGEEQYEAMNELRRAHEVVTDAKQEEGVSSDPYKNLGILMYSGAGLFGVIVGFGAMQIEKIMQTIFDFFSRFLGSNNKNVATLSISIICGTISTSLTFGVDKFMEKQHIEQEKARQSAKTTQPETKTTTKTEQPVITEASTPTPTEPNDSANSQIVTTQPQGQSV